MIENCECLLDNVGCLPLEVVGIHENVGCLPLAVIMMTTDNGSTRRFPEGIRFVIIFNIYRVCTNITELHADFAQCLQMSI